MSDLFRRHGFRVRTELTGGSAWARQVEGSSIYVVITGEDGCSHLRDADESFLIGLLDTADPERFQDDALILSQTEEKAMVEAEALRLAADLISRAGQC